MVFSPIVQLEKVDSSVNAVLIDGNSPIAITTYLSDILVNVHEKMHKVQFALSSWTTLK